MAEVKRSLLELTQNAAMYEKEFQMANVQAQEVSRIVASLKPKGVSSIGDGFSEASSDLSSDTGSVCSSETSSDLDFNRPKFGSSVYEVDEKPSARSKKGNERFRSRRKSQYDISNIA